MNSRSHVTGRVLAMVALMSMAACLTGPSARADDGYGRDHRGYGHDDWRAREWRERHRVYYGERHYVTPPPPVYYAPPPPPAGLNLFFHIR